MVIEQFPSATWAVLDVWRKTWSRTELRLGSFIFLPNRKRFLCATFIEENQMPMWKQIPDLSMTNMQPRFTVMIDEKSYWSALVQRVKHQSSPEGQQFKSQSKVSFPWQTGTCCFTARYHTWPILSHYVFLHHSKFQGYGFWSDLSCTGP